MKKLFQRLPLAGLVLGLLAISAQDPKAAPQPAAPAAPQAATTDAAVIQAQLPSYPLETCVISGHKLGEMGAPVDHVVTGRLVRLCCKDCIEAVAKDPKAALAKVDQAVIAMQSKSYPLETCVVSGEKLGSMGAPVDVVQGTRLVKLCCGDCKAELAKDPAKYLAKVDAALIEQQLKTYPLKVCPVSGETLGSMGEPINQLYGTQLVRLCCKGCQKPFAKDPQPVLAKIHAAAADAKKQGG